MDCVSIDVEGRREKEGRRKGKKLRRHIEETIGGRKIERPCDFSYPSDSRVGKRIAWTREGIGGRPSYVECGRLTPKEKGGRGGELGRRGMPEQ